MTTPLPLHDGLHGAEPGIASSLEHLGHQARDLALEGARGVRNQALHARDSTAAYVQERPLAALLLAAASGAAVMLLAGWLMRASAPRR